MKARRRLVVAGMGAAILLAFLIPALRPAKIGGGAPCITILKMIQNAKLMCADDLGLTNGAVFSKEQLLPYLGGRWPKCPKGGDYTIGTLGESPRCSYPQHAHVQVPLK
jgi:hypothetical protein